MANTGNVNYPLKRKTEKKERKKKKTRDEEMKNRKKEGRTECVPSLQTLS